MFIDRSPSGREPLFEREEREAADQLSELVRAKDELDHRAAVRSAVGAWLVLHLPLTFLLLGLAALHAVAARSFLLGSAP